MNRAQIFILILFSTGAGIGLYYYLQNKKNQVATANALQAKQLAQSTAALAAQKNEFCNPPTTNAIEKLVYQKKLAQAEWEKRGKGMDLDYFLDQYKQEMGCS